MNINFGQGLDTQTDPNQVPLGKMGALGNAQFNRGGELTKRNGFGLLPNTADPSSTYITTHNDNLLVLGNSLQVYAADTAQWLTKGNFQDVDLEVDTLVRTTTSQLSVDSAVALNKAICTVYADSDGKCYYTVGDSVSGEVILPSVALPNTATCPRVAVLNNNFMVTYLVTVGIVTHLQYIKVSCYNPQVINAPVILATDVKGLTAGYDIISANGDMYFAYHSTFGGDAVKISFVNTSFLLQGFTTLPGGIADLMSITCDISGNGVPTIYLSYWDALSGDVFTACYTSNLVNQVFAPTLVYNGTITEITSSAQSKLCTLFYQVTNTYNYSTTRTDYIDSNTIDFFAVVTAPSTILRSVGLASKSFIVDTVVYVLVNYAGAYQPSYFMIDNLGRVIAKLAYSNAMGNATLGQYAYSQVLPQGNIDSSVVEVAYLNKDLLAPLNKLVSAGQVAGIYTQTGINLATFDLNSGRIDSREIAGAVHITGGFPWMYDGTTPVEHSFFLWPEDLAVTDANTGGGMKRQQYFYVATYEWTDASGNIHRSAPSVPLSINDTTTALAPVTTTGTWTSGDTVLTVASTAGFYLGQVLEDITNPGRIQFGSKIIAIDSIGLTLTIDAPTMGNGAGDTISTNDTFAYTIQVPTLRITYKGAPNNARIVIYRWALDLQTFYQITSIPSPITNDTSIDSITYVDTQNSQAIIGNLLLYTTGGVLENIQAPACTVSTLWKSRYWVVDAEDQNLLWYSKTVIENTPVETTNFQTLYVAPTTGAQGSTGPITALSTLDDKLIIFKHDAIYYITGNGPDITGSQNDYGDPVFITASVGCANQNSIVFMPDGLMFQSDKGIWILKRDLTTMYIGAPVDKYLSVPVLAALTVPGTNQVRFTLAGSNPTLMYDYYFGQWAEFNGIPALSSTLYQGKHSFVNKYGEVYQETEGKFLDGALPVLMSFTTAWAKFAGLQGFQRAYFFYLLGKYFSPHTLTLGIAFDYDPSIVQQVLIRPVNFSGYYGDDPIYGDQTPYGGPGQVEQWRVFLSRQKCESFQITLQENFDSSYGAPAGAGLNLSGINLIYGSKKGYTTLTPSLSVG